MRVYRRYRCDEGHEWVLRRKKGEPELDEDARCSDGHEAITCREEEPADEVQVLLRPAGRIVNPVTKQVAQSGSYDIVLLDREDQELRSSAKSYSWEEAIQIAGLFKGKTAEQALMWWERKPR